MMKEEEDNSREFIRYGTKTTNNSQFATDSDILVSCDSSVLSAKRERGREGAKDVEEEMMYREKKNLDRSLEQMDLEPQKAWIRKRRGFVFSTFSSVLLAL